MKFLQVELALLFDSDDLFHGADFPGHRTHEGCFSVAALSTNDECFPGFDAYLQKVGLIGGKRSKLGELL